MMSIVDSKGLDRADTVTFLDGAVVLLRRLDAHDAKAVEAFHSDLTDRDRYYRFFVIHPGFLHRFASKLVENSPTNYAIGAFEAGRLIGVANYVRSNDPEVGDVAIAVAHKDHLRGVATAMLRHLGEVAREGGGYRNVFAGGPSGAGRVGTKLRALVPGMIVL